MITSTSNAQMKYIQQLNSKVRFRREEGCFAAEGFRLYQETPRSLRQKVYLSASFAEEHPELAKVPLTEIVDDNVFTKVCDTRTPQGILTIVRMPECSLEEMLPAGRRPLIMVLEGLQDPGNVGTIIRTAEGAGVTGIIIGGNTVDIFQPKVIRSTMGSIFRVPVCQEEDLGAVVTWLKEKRVKCFAAHLKGEQDYTTADYTGGCAFLVGNEGRGLSDELAGMTDAWVRIPMEGKVESLNVAIASSLLMYEARRQRS